MCLLLELLFRLLYAVNTYVWRIVNYHVKSIGEVEYPLWVKECRRTVLITRIPASESLRGLVWKAVFLQLITYFHLEPFITFPVILFCCRRRCSEMSSAHSAISKPTHRSPQSHALWRGARPLLVRESDGGHTHHGTMAWIIRCHQTAWRFGQVDTLRLHCR